MSMELHLYQDPTRGLLSTDDVAERLQQLPGFSWHKQQNSYRPFTIRDPRTGAWAEGDCGQPDDLERTTCIKKKPILMSMTLVYDCSCH